jgi:hypothetical protein
MAPTGYLTTLIFIWAAEKNVSSKSTQIANIKIFLYYKKIRIALFVVVIIINYFS